MKQCIEIYAPTHYKTNPTGFFHSEALLERSPGRLSRPNLGPTECLQVPKDPVLMRSVRPIHHPVGALCIRNGKGIEQ